MTPRFCVLAAAAVMMAQQASAYEVGVYVTSSDGSSGAQLDFGDFQGSDCDSYVPPMPPGGPYLQAASCVNGQWAYCAYDECHGLQPWDFYLWTTGATTPMYATVIVFLEDDGTTLGGMYPGRGPWFLVNVTTGTWYSPIWLNGLDPTGDPASGYAVVAATNVLAPVWDGSGLCDGTHLSLSPPVMIPEPTPVLPLLIGVTISGYRMARRIAGNK